jgi:hypothetical protein
MPMLFRLAGRLVWFTGKFTVKHILVPIAITAATAVVLEKLADRIEPNGVAVDPEGNPYTDLSRA